MADLDLDNSFHRLQSFDASDLDDVEACQIRWIEEAKKKLKCKEEDNLDSDLFMTLTKPVLSRWIADAREIMCRQRRMMTDFKDIIGTLKTEALGDKEKVIKLQSDLLQRKEEQLITLQSAVKTTVQDEQSRQKYSLIATP